MPEPSDANLLRQYADKRDETAFRTLVARYADLVYSAALRQVDLPDLASDVAQSVFLDTARKARRLAVGLSEGGSLAGWLYRSTRFAALTQRRTERRRRTREREAMKFMESPDEPQPDWERLRPVLDDAMNALNAGDREALLLRFFQNCDLRSVGRCLGVSDDAAQKRVTRALQRLRCQFIHRGITDSTAAISSALSVHATAPAPTGLAANLATAAVTASTAATTATATLTKAIAMTTLQKTVFAAAFAVALGTGIYEARQSSRLRRQVQMLHQQQAPLAAQIQTLTHGRGDLQRQLATLRDENQRLNRHTRELMRLRGEVTRLRKQAQAAAHQPPPPTDASVEAAARSWATRVSDLKNRLQQTPDARIPELRLLSDKDWLDVVKDNPLKTADDYRHAFSQLRTVAENIVGHRLQVAMKRYTSANGGRTANSLDQLRPYLDPSLEDSVLQRYEIMPQEKFRSVKLGGKWVIALKAPVDPLLDDHLAFGPNGSGSTGFLDARLADALAPAMRAFCASNNGAIATTPKQLAPYLTTPEERAALQQAIQEFHFQTQ